MYVVEALEFFDEAIISDDLEIAKSRTVTWSRAVYISRSPEDAHLKKKNQFNPMHNGK